MRYLTNILIFFTGFGIFSLINILACRIYGKSIIRIRDILLMALGAVIAIACFLNGKKWEESITIFAFYDILTIIALLDFEIMEIKNGCVITLLLIAVLSVFTIPSIPLIDRAIGAVCVSVPLLLTVMLIPGAFGGGDIKLMAACGLFLGWKLTLVSFAIAVIAGGVYSGYLLFAKKADRRTSFPFGPFLCLGMAIGLPYGRHLIEWYISSI